MNTVAKEAVSKAKNTQKKKTGRPGSSRDDGKFLARLPPEMRKRLEVSSALVGQSMNSFLVNALGDYLDVCEKQQIVLEALVLLRKQKESEVIEGEGGE